MEGGKKSDSLLFGPILSVLSHFQCKALIWLLLRRKPIILVRATEDLWCHGTWLTGRSSLLSKILDHCVRCTTFMFTQGVYYFEMIAMNKPQLYVDSKEPLYLHGNFFSQGIFWSSRVNWGQLLGCCIQAQFH